MLSASLNKTFPSFRNVGSDSSGVTEYIFGGPDLRMGGGGGGGGGR